MILDYKHMKQIYKYQLLHSIFSFIHLHFCCYKFNTCFHWNFDHNIRDDFQTY